MYYGKQNMEQFYIGWQKCDTVYALCMHILNTLWALGPSISPSHLFFLLWSCRLFPSRLEIALK